MTVYPTMRRAATYGSPWLFAGLLLALSALAWWVLSGAPTGASGATTPQSGVFVPVYDPASGRTVARWRTDWPADVPVPTTQQVMTRALAEAVAAETSDGPTAPPAGDARESAVTAPSLASLRRACVAATRRGSDPERTCDRFAAASRPTLPAVVVRPAAPSPGVDTNPAAPSLPMASEEAAVRRWLNGAPCPEATHGSVAWRTCRIRYGEELDTTCHERTQAELTIGASPDADQRRSTRAVCAASRRYQAIDS